MGNSNTNPMVLSGAKTELKRRSYGQNGVGYYARRQRSTTVTLSGSRMALKPFKTHSRPWYILGDCAKRLCQAIVPLSGSPTAPGAL